MSMTKPEDVPQWAWDKAVAAFHVGGEPYVDAKAEAIARAILSAVEEEREGCLADLAALKSTMSDPLLRRAQDVTLEVARSTIRSRKEARHEQL